MRSDARIMNSLQRALRCTKCYSAFLQESISGKRADHLTVVLSRPFMKTSVEKPVFQPRRIVILTKTTRYEYEKKLHPGLTEEKLKATLEERGSDYYRILQRYETHVANLQKVVDCLERLDIESRVVPRTEYNESIVDWADAVMSAGGDGTFLLAASKIRSRSTPLIGINTDPDRSEGFLCLPKSSCRLFPEVMELLTSGKFRWSWRQRIRITMSGKHDDDDPVSLRDQHDQLMVEDRFAEHVQEHELDHNVSYVKPVRPERVLPVLALNEVFFGEHLSARVSYYEISFDESVPFKQKSSGVTVSTGTGSTSWLFNINQLSPNDVEKVLRIASDAGGMLFPVDNLNMIKKITNEYNNSLKFDASEVQMAYTIRDPIVNGIFEVTDSKGFAKKVRVKSRMWDACLVVDGSVSFKFNDGATATLDMFEEDALRTVTLEGRQGAGFLGIS